MNADRRLFAYIRREWRFLVPGLLFMVGYVLLSGFSILTSKPIIEGLFTAPPAVNAPPPLAAAEVGPEFSALLHRVGGELSAGHLTAAGRVGSDGLKEILARSPKTKVLGFICVTALVVILLRNLFDYLRKILVTRVEQRATEAVRNDLYARIIHFPLSAFDRSHSGAIISRAVNDVEAIKNFTVGGAMQILLNGLLSLMCVAIIFKTDSRLALTTLLILPPLIIILGRLAVSLKRRSVRAQQRLADIQEQLQETVGAIRVVKGFAREDAEQARFRRATDRYRRSVTRLLSMDQLAAPLSEFWAVSIGVIILWYGGHRVLDPTSGLSGGNFVVFLLAMFSLMHPLKEVAGALGKLQRGRAAAERVFEMMDAPTEPLDGAGVPIDGFRRSIRFRNVSFSYDGETPVLRGIDFEVRAGQTVAIVGASGAGKTTLVDLIPRFYEPTAGRIEIDGVDTRTVRLKELRRLMGIVTQETILFDDTVAANIAYGRPEATREEVIDAARAANADAFIREIPGTPGGYEARIGESGQLLSGGQRQRLAIARAILRNPPILILDEATSSLDAESEALVQDAIEHLLRDRTTFVIAHRLSTVVRADRILVLDAGKIIEDGTHGELLARDGAYARLYRRQFRDDPPPAAPSPALAPAAG